MVKNVALSIFFYNKAFMGLSNIVWSLFDTIKGRLGFVLLIKVNAMPLQLSLFLGLQKKHDRGCYHTI